MPDIDLPNLEPYFRGQARHIYDALRQVPALEIGARFISDLVNALNDFRENHGRRLTASDLRLRITELICALVREVSHADCVFIRRLQSDGSVQLYGKPTWSSEQRWGYPPHGKRVNEGVSGRILNSGITHPVVIHQVQAENNPYWDDHQRTFDRHAAGTDVHVFLSHIKAECCVPLTVRSVVFAGIVCVRWRPYTPEQAELVRLDLTKWQAVLASMYHAGLQLERSEELQGGIREYTAILASDNRPSADDEFLREMVTVLTCDAGLRWHRALVFAFDGTYPADAKCVMAVGGTGEPGWSARQSEDGGLTLQEYLTRARAHDYALPDPLFRLAMARPTPLVVAAATLTGHRGLHAMLTHAAQASQSLVTGLVVLNPEDPWFTSQPWYSQACMDGARACVRYVCPLFSPARRIPLGFVLLDNPYPRPLERSVNLSATRLLCESFAGQFSDRAIGGAPPERPAAQQTPAPPGSGQQACAHKQRLTASDKSDTNQYDAGSGGQKPAEGKDSTLAQNSEKVQQESDSDRLLKDSVGTFESDLPGLLDEHEGKWVAYVGKQRIGFADTQSRILEICHSKGYKDDSLFVSRIEPDLPAAYAGWEV